MWLHFSIQLEQISGVYYISKSPRFHFGFHNCSSEREQWHHFGWFVAQIDYVFVQDGALTHWVRGDGNGAPHGFSKSAELLMKEEGGETDEGNQGRDRHLIWII